MEKLTFEEQLEGTEGGIEAFIARKSFRQEEQPVQRPWGRNMHGLEELSGAGAE